MKKIGFLVVAVVGIVILAFTLSTCGRSASRAGGKAFRQVLKVENFKKFISVSFDKRGSSTVKDVTFLATDGYVYTREFKDISPIEGVIRWVPNGEGSDLIQSRSISRWIGGAVNLELPEDCVTVLGVDIGYLSENERVKNLTYLSKDGAIYSKEYLEGIVDRQFEGWLEIGAK